MVTLGINPYIVCQIIHRARQFHVKEEADADASNPTDDLMLEVLVDTEEDAVFDELQAEIDKLEPDQQSELVALMWLGRGDYEVSEWKKIVKEATSRATVPTSEYLLRTPLVADYLEEGLAQLGYHCEGNE